MVSIAGPLGAVATITGGTFFILDYIQRQAAKPVEKLEGKMDRLEEKMEELRAEVRADNSALRAEVRADSAALRTELKGDIAALGSKLDKVLWQLIEERRPAGKKKPL